MELHIYWYIFHLYNHLVDFWWQITRGKYTIQGDPIRGTPGEIGEIYHVQPGKGPLREEACLDSADAVSLQLHTCLHASPLHLP